MPIARGIALTKVDRVRRTIIEQLMCQLKADPYQIAADGGIDLDDIAETEPTLRELEADGLVERDGDRIIVTQAGRPFVRAVAAAFDAYLPRGVARHSVAV